MRHRGFSLNPAKVIVPCNNLLLHCHWLFANCFPPLLIQQTLTLWYRPSNMQLHSGKTPADPFKPATDKQSDFCTPGQALLGSYNWGDHRRCLIDSSMYVDKEALSCQAGQLSELNTEPQHLSSLLAVEESCQRLHCSGACVLKGK